MLRALCMIPLALGALFVLAGITTLSKAPWDNRDTLVGFLIGASIPLILGLGLITLAVWGFRRAGQSTTTDYSLGTPTSLDREDRQRIVGLIVFGLVCFVGSAAALLQNGTWVARAFRGPSTITFAEISKLQTPDSLPTPYVTLKCNKIVPTDLGLDERRGTKTTRKSKYLLVQVDDRWLLTEVPPNFNGQEITGILGTWSNPLQKEGISKVHAAYKNHQFMPFQLDAETDYVGEVRSFLYLVGAFGTIGVLSLGGAGLLLFLSRLGPRSLDPNEAASALLSPLSACPHCGTGLTENNKLQEKLYKCPNGSCARLIYQ